MDFPHLPDTKYPYLDNVSNPGYENRFDYLRWVPNTKVKLCSVRWNSDYSDVVKFDTDQLRDEWFDQLPTDPYCEVVLNTNKQLGSDNTVKVPIPYDRASQFNYCVVDIPIATSADAPIDYESEYGFHRWFFFVTDFVQVNPSTTLLTLSLDVWTQYINSVGITYMVLERGHAPVAATDVDSYLANPMENSELLLAPDENFGNDTVSRGSRFIPFGSGEKWLCIASVCPPNMLSQLGTVTDGSSASYSDPVFSDEEGYPNDAMRWGHQYHVDGFGFGSGRDYSGVTTAVGNVGSSDGRIPNNVSMYAVPADDAFGGNLLSDLVRVCPTFLRTVSACFVVAREMFDVGNHHNIAGHVLYEVRGNSRDLGDVTLTKDMFAYPDEYAGFAKLYTYPYAQLEITDNEGKSATVRIETTSGIKAHAVTSLAFPYLNMRMFLTGIGGSGSESYQWRDLSGVHDEQMRNSDWYRFCYDFGIPTFALYMDGATSWQVQNWNRALGNARNSALINYHNSVRQANNAMANAVDAADTAQTNSNNSARNAYTNAVNSANTAQTNTNNDANTLDKNHANTRACRTDVCANINATNNTNQSLRNTRLLQQTEFANSLQKNQTDLANSVCIENNEVTNNNSISTTLMSGLSSVASGVMSGAVGGSVIPGIGTALGAAAGGGSALVGAMIGSYNASITANANTTVVDNTTSMNTKATVFTQNNNISNMISTSTVNTTITNNDNVLRTDNTARENDCDAANTSNTSGTMRTNAANTRNTSVTNAGNTRDTAVGNAANTRNNAASNAGWTRDATVTAAQDVARNTQRDAMAGLLDARNDAPVELCPASGDATSEYMRTRGVQVKVRTQSKSAIRMAGDTFARFGYALNQIWNVAKSGLKLMRHFTYWKASDIWVYDVCETNDTPQNAIVSIFEKGVTVWNDPDEIGMVSPYDN